VLYQLHLPWYVFLQNPLNRTLLGYISDLAKLQYLIQVAFAFFLGVVCDQGITIHLKRKNMGTSSNNPTIAERTRGFRTSEILSMVFMFLSFCVGVIGWGVGLWLEDSMSMNGRRDSSGSNDMRRLSHPEGQTAV
jgi:hypothetical protein